MSGKPFVGFKFSRIVLERIGVLGVALLLACGSLLVGTHPAFASSLCPLNTENIVHTATSANTTASYTFLTDLGGQYSQCIPDHLFVTPNWNPGGVYHGFDNHPVGVWYQANGGPWAIINEDGAPMPLGASFNVYYVNTYDQTNPNYIVRATATASSYITYMNDPTLNNNPSAQLIVTPVMGEIYGSGTALDPHQIGVWYDTYAHEWTIYNEDHSQIPNGASFNVMVVNPAGLFPASFTQVATSSNTSGDSTCINSPLSNSNPHAYVYVTHVYSGYFTDVPAVWYNGDQWCIFDGSYQNMPLGATFTVGLPA